MKLTIPYPKDAIDKLLISNTFLPKFEALEELHFINFLGKYHANHYVRELYQPPQKSVVPFLERENYWRICQNF